MAFNISKLARKPGDPLFYDPDFRLVIEMHLPLLRQDRSMQQVPIEGDQLSKYAGDFYGLLSSMSVPLEHQWTVMRINGLDASHQFGAQLNNPYVDRYQFILMLPTTQSLVRIKQLYLSTSG